MYISQIQVVDALHKDRTVFVMQTSITIPLGQTQLFGMKLIVNEDFQCKNYPQCINDAHNISIKSDTT